MKFKQLKDYINSLQLDDDAEVLQEGHSSVYSFESDTLPSHILQVDGNTLVISAYD